MRPRAGARAADEQQAGEQEHRDQHEHEIGPAGIDQQAERHWRHRLPERQPGADEPEHLADLAGRRRVLDHHVARRAARADQHPAGEQGCDRADVGQRHPGDHQDESGREQGCGYGKTQQTLRAVGDPAADQDAARCAGHVGGERG